MLEKETAVGGVEVGLWIPQLLSGSNLERQVEVAMPRFSLIKSGT